MKQDDRTSMLSRLRRTDGPTKWSNESSDWSSVRLEALSLVQSNTRRYTLHFLRDRTESGECVSSNVDSQFNSKRAPAERLVYVSLNLHPPNDIGKPTLARK